MIIVGSVEAVLGVCCMQMGWPRPAEEDCRPRDAVVGDLAVDAGADESRVVVWTFIRLVLLVFGCKDTSGHSARFEAYGVPRWSVPASGRVGVYKCKWCEWLGSCRPSVSCMMESEFASDELGFKLGDIWSRGDGAAWLVLPEPLEAMVEVLGPVDDWVQFAVVVGAVSTILL